MIKRWRYLVPSATREKLFRFAEFVILVVDHQCAWGRDRHEGARTKDDWI